MVDLYALMGNPVSHSISPFIHYEFAKQTHQAIKYEKIQVPLDKLKEYVTVFGLQQGKGLNITLPFKQQAFQLVSECSERAKIAKAVNTISFIDEQQWYGENTDGVGFIQDLVGNHHFSIKNKTILIFGAGGAVRGILGSLLKKEPKEIILANRTLASAENLAEEYGAYGVVKPTSLSQITGSFDLIIHATSMSFQQEEIDFTQEILTPNTFCYDLMYGQKPTPFLKWAASQGVKQLTDGIGMLVEQAAESFFIWRGIKPETKSIIERIRQQSG